MGGLSRGIWLLVVAEFSLVSAIDREPNGWAPNTARRQLYHLDKRRYPGMRLGRHIANTRACGWVTPARQAAEQSLRRRRCPAGQTLRSPRADMQESAFAHR